METADLFAKLIVRFAPDQAGALWIGVLLVILLVGDFKKLMSARNGLLLLLLLPALPLMDLMVWESRLGDPTTAWLLSAAFTALFLVTALVAAASLVLVFRRPDVDWSPTVPKTGLRMLLAVVVVMNVLVVLGRPGEDSGPYTSLGAQRWIETGTMPYGDPLLRGPDAPGFGAAATYGPLLYVAHMPLQLVFGTPVNSPNLDPMNPEYIRPTEYVTKLTCLAFQLLALFALVQIGRRLASEEIGLTMAILYAGSPYVLGLGSDTALITGLPFISHIAPPAMVLMALLLLERPVLSGLMLAGAVGVLFWPIFLFPLFLGWYVWQQRSHTLRFVAGFAGAGAVIALMVVYYTGSIGDQGPIDLLLSSTLEHQEGFGSREYGASVFSFWGTHPGLASFWQRPLLGDTSVFKPSFLLFAGLSAGAFLLVKGRDKVQLALLIALISSAVQLWKTHAGGTYVEWYLPFLLIGIFCARVQERTSGRAARA